MFQRLFACCLLIGAQSIFAQNPFRLRCDPVDTTKFPLVTLNVGIDSLSNPITTLRDSELVVYEYGNRRIATFLPGTCHEDSLSVVLVVDESTSMNDMLNNGTRLSAAKNACTNFTNRLTMPPTEVALIGFNNRATVHRSFTKNRQLVTTAIQALTTGPGTNITDAIVQALALLRGRTGRRVILFLTDGQESPDHGFSTSYPTYAATAVRDSIRIFTIGLLSPFSAGEAPLQGLAKGTGGLYFRAPSAAQLIAIYDSIYTQLLSGYCDATYSSMFCDSGPRAITVVFTRGIYSDTCSQAFYAPAPPSNCGCPHVAYAPTAALDAAYPNPVPPFHSARISYRMDHDGPVSLTVYNMLGSAVSMPVHGTQTAGVHEVELAGNGFPTGIYMYRLVVGDQVFTRSLSITR